MWVSLHCNNESEIKMCKSDLIFVINFTLKKSW